MNTQINITVNVPRPQTEAERFWEASKGLEKMMTTMADNKIAYEQRHGNPIFSNVETWEQYLAALDLDDKRKRRELGFWKYHFGDQS